MGHSPSDVFDFTQPFRLRLYNRIFLTWEEEKEFYEKGYIEVDGAHYHPPSNIEIPVTIHQLIQTWDGVKVDSDNPKAHNDKDFENKRVLKYNPHTGKTYNHLNVPHIKGIARDEKVSVSNEMYHLFGLRDTIPFPEIQSIESSYNSSKLLIVPFEPLSLFVHHNIEEHELWHPFLKSIGIPEKKDFFDDFRQTVCFAIIDIDYLSKPLDSETESEYTQAIISTGFSMSSHHVSFGFRKNKWYRFDRSEKLYFGSIEDCFNCQSVPHFTCLNIEELNLGFAILHQDYTKRVLLNTYNQYILHLNNSERYFHYFQPKKIKNEIFIIATREIPSKGNSTARTPTYEWNIYNLSNSNWLFRKSFPKGLAFWRKNGSVLILRRNLWMIEKFSREYLDFVNQMGFKFCFADQVEFENSIIGIGKGRLLIKEFNLVQEETDLSTDFEFSLEDSDTSAFEIDKEPTFFWQSSIQSLFDKSDKKEENEFEEVENEFTRIEDSIEPVPQSVIEDILYERECEEEYRSVLSEESSYNSMLDELNREGWREIRDSDPDWPYD